MTIDVKAELLQSGLLLRRSDLLHSPSRKRSKLGQLAGLPTERSEVFAGALRLMGRRSNGPILGASAKSIPEMAPPRCMQWLVGPVRQMIDSGLLDCWSSAFSADTLSPELAAGGSSHA